MESGGGLTEARRIYCTERKNKAERERENTKCKQDVLYGEGKREAKHRQREVKQ